MSKEENEKRRKEKEEENTNKKSSSMTFELSNYRIDNKYLEDKFLV